MATNMMDKGMYAAPMGLGMDSMEPVLEIEIENPDAVTLSDGSMEITLEAEDEKEKGEFGANLAEEMDDGELATLATELLELVDADIASRKDWTETYVKGLEVLGTKYEERTEPWNGACGVYSTVLTEAAIRFQSETITETFPAQGPVKTEIIGAIDKLKEQAAQRVQDDMNFKLTEEMPEYRPEHERMLFNLGLAGSAFKKVYFDPGLGRQTSIFVPAEDVIIPYGSSGARMAERVTHVMRKTKNDIKKLQVAGFYRDIDLGEPVMNHTDVEKKKAEEQGYSVTDDDRYQVYEIQVDWNLKGYEDEDEVAVPYIVTIDKGTQEVLAIYRNWEESDENYQKRQHLVQYDYIPGFGAYGMGLIHIIGGYARAGTSLIRQLVDAGTLSNLPGGLKSRGLRVKGDDTPIAPGEFRDVDVPSGSIKDNIMTLPYKEPSQVLMALLNQITDEGRRLGSIADMKVSDMSAQAPVGTTLALLERQLKIMGAVQARVHNAMKQEFKILKAIIRDNTPSQYDYEPQSGNASAKQEDYDMVEVIPVSDPNSSTMAQRIMQYQAVIQLAQQAPQIYNLPNLHRQMIEVLGIKNADKLVPIEDDQTPRDPISENMAFLNGEPTKAFIYQDHDAHIAAHSTFMQDPMIAQQMGQNPMAQQMMGAIQAHIAEHLAFLYRKKIEEQLGVPLPKPNEQMPEEMEVQLSQLVAQASTQLLQQNMAMVQQQKNQQMQQDPLIQMQQAELQIKQQEAQTRAAKVQGELQLKAQELQIKQQEMVSKQGENPAIAAAKAQQDMENKRMAQGLMAMQKQQELRHKDMAHRQKLTHAEQVARQKAALAAQTPQLRKPE
jgi:chaperonin GroES